MRNPSTALALIALIVLASIATACSQSATSRTDAQAARGASASPTAAAGIDLGAAAAAASGDAGAADDDDDDEEGEGDDEGEPTDAGVPEATDGGPPIWETSSWDVEMPKANPFGCTIRAIEREVVVREPERNPQLRTWAERVRRFALIPAAIGAQLTRPGAVYVVTSAGLCRATVGSPVYAGSGRRPILGNRISGCSRGAAPFAFVCEPATRLPRGPRWTPIESMRVRRFAGTGQTGDALVDRSFRAFNVLLPRSSLPEFRRARDRGESLRRAGVRSFTLRQETLRVVDLGWSFFEEDEDPSSGSACPHLELFATALYLPSAEATAPAADAGVRAGEPWRRVGAFRNTQGIVHDGARILAVANTQSTTTPGPCWGAESCREVVVHPRGAMRFERGARAPYAFGGGERSDRTPLSVSNGRSCPPP